MDAELVDESGAKVLRVAGEVLIADAARFRDLLIDLVESAGARTIDASRLDRFDTSAAQLLVAAREACEGSGHCLAVIGLSPACAEDLSLLGCRDVLAISRIGTS
jgi:anti-anti-sigma factor